ncbi:MAG: hypothetical protein II969_18820 [Anaerolineaceae bacterium]|nr:hypothetical protein [Anaerolineaceae bacterium]
MAETKSSFVNNFTVSVQNLNVILDAKCTAPNIEKTGYDVPPVFDAHKIVDESYLFMPLGVAKELAISLMQIISDVEKRSTFRVRLNGDKEAYWNEAIRAINEYKESKES